MQQTRLSCLFAGHHVKGQYKRGRGIKTVRPQKAKEKEGRVEEISPETLGSDLDKQRSQTANATYQTDSDSLAAAYFNMPSRSSIHKHFKLGKFKTYTDALGFTATQ